MNEPKFEPLDFNEFAEICHEAHIAFCLDKFPSEERALEHFYLERLNAQAARTESEGERWPNVEAAMQDPLFQRARALMGTENWFQDNALRNVVNYVLAADAESLRAENAKLREDIAEMVRADADHALAAFRAVPDAATKLRFFRDLSDDERLKVFKVFGLLTDEIIESERHALTHTTQSRLFEKLIAAAPTPPSPPQTCA